jgi:formate hydrogenlyase subunit 3/multisubunit Na+/H+ antiporter MnhD subunit
MNQNEITNILRGITGHFEITRVLGALGVLLYAIAVHLFVGYEVLYLGKTFDLVAYCTAFPAGFAIIIGTVSAAAGIKDRNVAVAQTVSDTGSKPQ